MLHDINRVLNAASMVHKDVELGLAPKNKDAAKIIKKERKEVDVTM